MKRNQIMFNENNEAVVTKAFQKQARIFGTDEYKLWREVLKENPGVKMAIKSIKKNPNKDNNRNLTYSNMREYLSTMENGAELLKDFDTQLKRAKVQSSPYRFVLAWFLKTCEGYDGYKEFFEEKERQRQIEIADSEKLSA